MTDLFRSLTSGTTQLVTGLAAGVPRLLLALAVFVVGLLVADFARHRVFNLITRSQRGNRISVGLAQVVFIGIVVLAVLVALTIVGVDPGSLVAGLGLTSLAIGFVMRDILENTSAGILLSFSQPFAIGDVVRVGADEGTVVDISVRATKIKTADGTEIYIPNRLIYTGIVENKTAFAERRCSIELPVPPETDLRTACALSARAAAQVPGVLVTPDATAQGIIDAAGAVRVRVYYWINSRADASRLSTLVTAAVFEQLHAAPESQPGGSS